MNEHPRVADSEPLEGPRYFVRDDDIGSLTPALTNFVETFIERAIPVSYQVIPSQFTDECAQYMLEKARAHPQLIEFGQHGLHHRMVLGRKLLKREFGPERSYDEQFNDICEGKRLLRLKLGADHDIKLFTPPQHKFDKHTVEAIAAAGHTLFSAASYPTAHHQTAYALGRALGLSSIRHHGISYHGRMRPDAKLLELSISIAVDDGRKITCSAQVLEAALKRASAHTNKVGLMFHHGVYADAPDELTAIIDRLSNRPHAQFQKLGDLATA
ncbi:MAG: hypothetical protein Q8R82_00235 [Hyphomonadaceae bacterium]|nr:hypothetical protein [Hyphomonadaceae bacterium]